MAEQTVAAKAPTARQRDRLEGVGAQVKKERKARRAERSKKQRSPAGPLSASLVILIAITALAMAYLRAPSPGRGLSLDALTRSAVCGSPRAPETDPSLVAYCNGVDTRVDSATFLDQDSRIVGSLTGPGGTRDRFWTSYPRSDAATNDLLRSLFASGTTVRIDPQPAKATVAFVAQFLLPLVLLANLFALLFYLTQGKGSGTSEFLAFGRVGDRRQGTKSDHKVTFADVAGSKEAVAELAEVRDYLADRAAFAAMGALPPKGVLLVGPPGCGKTLLARAVAGEAEASFFSMSGSEFVEALVGVGAARVRDLFSQARAQAPAIIFIDELDAVGRQRGAGMGQGHDEREQTLNELLVQMDGFSPAQGIVAMAATNRPDILDRALLRAGRFERHVTVERPDLEGREAILGLHAAGCPLSGQDLARVARRTAGFTGADLANVVNEAALLAVRERSTAIGSHHLDEAVERVQSGPKRKGQLISADERRCVAYHEAGHAVVAAAMGKAASVDKMSLVARGRGMAHLAVMGEDRTILRRGDMEAQIAIALGGVAAEELIFGEPSTGAEFDIERATATARDMAGRYGMSTAVGRVRVLREDKEVFLGRDYLDTRDVSQPTLEQLDAEVRRIVEEQEQAGATILADNRRVLDELAEALVTQETIQGARLQQVLETVSPPAERPAVAARGGRARRDGS